MRYRWTIHDLDTMDHVRFLKALINERQGSDLNPYAPLYRRLEETKQWLSTVQTELPKGLRNDSPPPPPVNERGEGRERR